jgi:membrane associated rhomboid family serine protease
MFIVFIGLLAYEFIIGGGANVDKFSHLGGLSTGFILGLYFLATYRQSFIFKMRWVFPYLLVIKETVFIVLIFVTK